MSTPLLHKAYDASAFHAKAVHLMQRLSDHLSACSDDENGQVIRYVQPDKEYEHWENRLAEGPDLAEFLDEVIKRSIHIHNPGYIGHQVAPAAPASALATFVSDLMNNGSAVYEMGAANAALERWVTNWLCHKFGWSNGEGVLTSGGTLANLTALLTARRVMAKEDVWNEGYSKPLAILVSDQAHYCVDRAARIMGIGAEGLIKVPVDDHYRMCADLLQEAYDRAVEQGRQVIALVGSAPSTATGTYDDLDALADFAEQKKLWFHVDAAHGGAAIFSDKYSYLLEGAERADSILIDGHKMMATSSITTALLYRKAGHSYSTFQQEAHYLWESAEDPEWFNLGKRTFECTKSMMSLRFLGIIVEHGEAFFNDFVTTLYGQGRRFGELVAAHPLLELAVEPTTNIVCFRFRGELPEAALDKLNQAIRRSLLEEGDFYIVATQLKKGYHLRTTFMNPFTTEAHMQQLLDRVTELASELKQTTHAD
jgi:L-2,4-diaminobutyrate decarboxylase